MQKITTKNQALFIFDLLGIKDSSSKRQIKNGTNEYTLPFQRVFADGSKKSIKFATYESGYVRNTSDFNSSSYQINKVVQVPKSEDRYFDGVERTLIPNHDDRIIFLANFIIKNHYDTSNKFQADQWTSEMVKDNHDRASMQGNGFEDEELTVVINGHRYDL
tara:strand:- start:86 stop:571 length:486 start_codon:yes stop_codon:yes gene_type:complete